MALTSLHDSPIQDALQLGPHLFLQCVFNPFYDVLDGIRNEPLTTTEKHRLTAYQQHCQQALKTLYQSLRSLPADRLTVRTAHTTFNIISREYLVYDDCTVVRCKCHGDNPLQPLPA